MQTKHKSAFTLIELLVVMAIIAIVTAIAVVLAGHANRARVLADARITIGALTLAVESYKADRGYYPPDNPANPRMNPLFYELHGADSTNNGFLVDGQQITSLQLANSVGVSGLVNANPGKNYLGKINTARPRNVNSPGAPVWILCGRSGGPQDLTAVDGPVNPICYLSTNPTNHPGGFDLWIDIQLGGKVERVARE